MKRRDVVRALLQPQPGPAPADPAAPPPRVAAGAVRAMGLQLDRLTEAASEAAALRERLASGGAVVELDPALVDPSFVADRLARTADREYRRLVESFRESGQLVPILVRPHPERPGRYQIAYGHRRRDAAAELARPVRAIVRALSDVELVVAQGSENAQRRNLSFIERARFAAHLAATGFDRPTLIAALGVQTAEMTRLLAVAAGVPEGIVQAIGPAPKAGRGRWMALAGALVRPGAAAAVQRLLQGPALHRMGSDQRFETVLAELREPAIPAEGGSAAEGLPPGAGLKLIRVERRGPILRLTLDERRAPGLGRLVLERLGDLLARGAD